MHQPLLFRRSPDSSRRARFGAHAWPERSRAALEADLRAAVEGEVRFDAGSRALYATDGSNYRQVPLGVVLPRDADDVVATVRVCRGHGAPIVGRGGGTSLAGQCCNVAVVIDCSKYMNRIVALDPDARRARVQPGVILDRLRDAAERDHLTFAPDPATHNHCTLGGMIGNNSCGVHSLMAGKTDENVEELDILLYDGTRLRVGATSDEERARIVADGGRRGDIYAKLRALIDEHAGAIRREYPKIPRRVSGYNLPWLLPEQGFNVARALVGSESTCVTVLEATVRLVPSPRARTLVVLGYPDVYAAADQVPQILEYEPIGLEGMDDRLIRDVRHIGVREDSLQQLPPGGGWLLVEFGGDTREAADAHASRMLDDLKKKGRAPASRVFDDRVHEEQIWKVREAGLGATAHVTSDHPTWEGWEDSAVPPDRLGGYLRDLRKLLDRYHYIGDFYGHFGQGCLHTRIDFDLFTEDGITKYRSFIDDAADLVVSYGGSLSGEHGDGQSKAEMLPKMYGAGIMRAFQEFKAIWDPDGRMNPGKIVKPYRIDENLRYGSDYNHASPPTHFRFPEEHGSFARAAQRCVGVGECRRLDGGTMCPSFQVTREEMHSTRGRAHLLWEMLEGDPVDGTWQDERVREALDLCLACKGCKSQCPVHVDMATYKAEFLSHYYERRFRPRTAWAFGLIHWWARLGSKAPSLVNFVTQTKGLSSLAKLIAGMPQARRIPTFAAQPFTDWFARRRRYARSSGARLGARRPSTFSTPGTSTSSPRSTVSTSTSSTGSTVLLWPDTFNNHFHPETAIAAMELLESAGFEVIVPRRPVCCGRPLYDYGLLPLAKKMLFSVIDAIRDEVRAGVPVIVLEPSCAAVFRDEMQNMLPHDEDAKRLGAQVSLLGEFVQAHRERFDLPSLSGRVLFHGHCHQKSIFDVSGDKALLESMGAIVDAPDTGCCGMAGSFGFEAGHQEISRKIGERVLLPAVRAAAPETIVVADGFSCREQIAQMSRRRAVHLAQALRAAQTNAGGIDRPELTLTIDHAAETAARLPAYAAAALIGIGSILAIAGLRRER